MKRFITQCIVTMFVFSGALHAANDNYSFGGRAAGMGNAAVTLYDFWAISHNQAGLARMENMAAGVYFENRFLVEDLSFGAGAFAYPLNFGVLGVSFTHFGTSLYMENKLGIAFSRSFSDRFSAGIQLNYLNTYIAEDFGNKANFGAELGIIFDITEELSLGAHLFNPTRASIGDYANERVPTIFRTGLGYTFSDRVILVAEVEQSVNLKTQFKAGLEYGITDMINVRLGVGTQPMSNSFGFGFHFGNLRMDLASSYHYILGYSPQLSLLYEFK